MRGGQYAGYDSAERMAQRSTSSMWVPSAQLLAYLNFYLASQNVNVPDIHLTVY